MKPLKSKYKRLTVISTATSRVIGNRKRWFVYVKCSCGVQKEVNAEDLSIGKIKSCGCLKREKNISKLKKVNSYIKNGRIVHPSKTHGDTHTRLWRIFRQMKQRCKNPKCHKYGAYGARGICVEWESYERFKEDMLESYDKHVKKHGEINTQIDRIDNDGNYCKENCRWATAKEQANNRRVRDTHHKICS